MDLWDKLKQAGAAALKELTSAASPEGQQLEFKQKKSPERDGLTDDDRRGLGESFSGMSNAQGGVVLFGVLTRRDEGGPDVADRPQPIFNVDKHAAQIAALQYLSPPNPNIEVHPIRTEGTSGVVAIRIGASVDRPHMSTAPGHHRYYQRVGDKNLMMADFQVRDMLSVNTSPRLQLGYILTHRAAAGLMVYVTLVLTLKNIGRVSASQPYVIVRPATTLRVMNSVEPDFVEFKLAAPDERGFQGSGRVALHPGYDVPAVMLDLPVNLQAGIRSPDGAQHYIPLDRYPLIEVVATFGAEHAISRDVHFSIDRTELAAMVDQVVKTRKPVTGQRVFS